MFSTQIYIYDSNNKNIYVSIYKKSSKKCLLLFNKTFSNSQATYQREFYLLFEKSADFSQSERRDWFDFSPPPVGFHSLFKDPSSPLHNKPFIKNGLLEEMEGVNDNASAFMHLNIKTNKQWQKTIFKPSRVIYVRKLSSNFMLMQIRKPENEGTFFRD